MARVAQPTRFDLMTQIDAFAGDIDPALKNAFRAIRVSRVSDPSVVKEQIEKIFNAHMQIRATQFANNNQAVKDEIEKKLTSKNITDANERLDAKREITVEVFREQNKAESDKIEDFKAALIKSQRTTLDYHRSRASLTALQRNLKGKRKGKDLEELELDLDKSQRVSVTPTYERGIASYLRLRTVDGLVGNSNLDIQVDKSGTQISFNALDADACVRVAEIFAQKWEKGNTVKISLGARTPIDSSTLREHAILMIATMCARGIPRENININGFYPTEQEEKEIQQQIEKQKARFRRELEKADREIRKQDAGDDGVVAPDERTLESLLSDPDSVKLQGGPKP